MKVERPRYELTRVFGDGTQEDPEIIPIGPMPWDTQMKRRDLLGIGIGAASALILLDGNSHAQAAAGLQQFDSEYKGQKAAAIVPENVLHAHLLGVSTVGITSDGKMIVTGSQDQTIKLWSAQTGKLVGVINNNLKAINSLVFSPDGTMVISAEYGAIRLWSLPERELLSALQESPPQDIDALAISPDGATLASGSADSSIKLWSLPKGRLLTVLKGHDKAIKALVINFNGTILASGSEDASIKLWSLPEGKLLTTCKAHDTAIGALAISPDGKILVSGSLDASLKLWSLPACSLITTLPEQEYRIRALAISGDGKILVSAAGTAVKLWSLPEGKPLGELKGHKDHINALTFSPEGRILASGDADGVVILWDLQQRSFLTFLFDATTNRTDAVVYNRYDSRTGRTISYTLPCGSPIPPGAVCTCNCVPGTMPSYSPSPTLPPSYSPSPAIPSPRGRVCSCVPVCTCNKVCTCIPVG